MQFQQTDGRIFCEGPDGRLLAEATFPTAYGCIALLNHVFVDESLRRQGAASRMMEEIVRTLKEQGLLVCPTCPYAEAWFARHPEHAQLLTEMPIL